MASQLSQLTGRLTQHQAHALVDAVMEDEGLALTATAFEDETTGEWVFEAMCAEEPDLNRFGQIAAQALGGEVDFTLDQVDPSHDWVGESLKGLSPVAAGGFYVHGSHDAEAGANGLTPILIEAGQAFGTGHHATTTGCLEAIARLLKRERPQKMLDLGTGTGILAIALAKRSRQKIVASDNDPIAVAVTRENAHANKVGARIEALVAEGLENTRLRALGPYDLIVANILAGPLLALAPRISGATRSGGTIILSGLLDTQAARLISAYANHGFVLTERTSSKGWATLTLRKK